MSKKILDDLYEVYSIYSQDIVTRVIITVQYIKRNTNNFTILKYLYKNHSKYDLEFIKYLLMTMEESAITGIHIYKGKEYSNSNLIFRIHA